MLPKPSIPLPEAPPKPRETYFYHPGYKEPNDVLFRLPRLDAASLSSSSSASAAASGHTGIHFSTALLACQIVANNAFDGYLSTDQSGTEQVALGPDDLLTGDSYWFHAHPPPEPRSHRDDANDTGDTNNATNTPQSPSHCACDKTTYPIVPSFQDWKFPHRHFRSLRWCSRSRSDNFTSPPEPGEDQTNSRLPNDSTSMLPTPMPTLQSYRTNRCALSGISYGIQNAHLIPAAEEKWFRRNGMKDCEGSSYSLQEDCNRLALRTDLHVAWDSHKFVLVPKGSQGHFAIHVLVTSDFPSYEFAADWHNTLVRADALEGKVYEYLFAKFAQAAFMLVKSFIVGSAVHRRVARLEVVEDYQGHEGFVINEQWMPVSELDEAYGGGGSRSGSAKRKRPSQQPEGEDDWCERNLRRRGSRDASEDDDDDDDDDDDTQDREELDHGRIYERYRRNSWGALIDDSTAAADAWYEENIRNREDERGRTRERRRHHQRRLSAAGMAGAVAGIDGVHTGVG